MIPKTQLCNDALQALQNAPPVKLKPVPFFRKLKNEHRLKQHAERLQAALARTDADDHGEIKMIVTAFLLQVDEERLLFTRPFLKFFLEKRLSGCGGAVHGTSQRTGWGVENLGSVSGDAKRLDYEQLAIVLGLAP